MNHETDQEQLLADVITEGAPAGFREAALGRTLRVVRLRRRVGYAMRAAMVLLFFGVGAFWFRLNRPLDSPQPFARDTAAPYQPIETQPLPASARVGTRPLAEDGFILAGSPVAKVETTRTSGGFKVIDDDQLLALVAARPAMLVRITPALEQLVFVNPEDENGFPAN
jgi:hypothetical protein